MYWVVLLSLLLLFASAFVLAAAGVLQFGLADMAGCLVLFMGVCYGANHLFAYLFSVRAHHLSALITGGILFFIFTPVLTVANLALYGFVAVTAIASKYVLVWRGRHIFNPAAIAAVIVALAGLQFASWWVAVMPLAIPVLLLAVVILYKTQRLQFGALFLVVYYAAVSVIAIVNGHSPFDVVTASAVAWVPLFFVGFMLSEPQAQPGRRVQYLTYAAFVGVLASLVAPEIALVLGNVFGFLVAQRSAILLKLVSRQAFPGGQEEYTFAPQRPLRYEAGQYLEITLPHARADLRGTRRMFTISSAPEEKTVKITTRYVDRSSSFKTAFRQLKVGQTISATAVRGDFVLPADVSQKLLFVAGGIGVTPFRSHIQSLLARNEKRDIVLLYAVRHANEVLFDDVIFTKASGVRVVVIANDAVSVRGKEYIQAPYVTDDVLVRVVPDIAQRRVYISGSPAMVAAVAKLARQHGARHVQTDDFTGY